MNEPSALITDRLTDDHGKFRALIEEIQTIAETPASSRDLPRLKEKVKILKNNLISHAWIEDEFLYPSVKESVQHAAGPGLSEAYIDHLTHEHDTIDGYLETLEMEITATPPAFSWPQTFALFYHGLKSHMRREESEFFPAAAKLLGREKLARMLADVQKHTPHFHPK